MRFLRKYMSNKKIEKNYVRAGAAVGDAVSYSYMGECVGFHLMLEGLVDWEKEYVNRGFRTVSIDDFVKYGGHGKSIDHLLGHKIENNEEPIFHAKTFRDDYLQELSLFNK